MAFYKPVTPQMNPTTISLNLPTKMPSSNAHLMEQITSDDSADIVKAVDLNRWKRLQCFCHWLHLAVGKREKLYVQGIKRC